MKFYTVVFLLVAISFRNANLPEKDVDSGNVENENGDCTRCNVSQTNDEFLDPASIRVNGQLPFISSLNLVSQIVGQADSIVAPDDICVSFYYDRDFNYGYFKGLQLEIYGDTTVIRSLNFQGNHNLFVNSPRIRLNHLTTLTDMETLFPHAVASKRELDVYGFGKATVIDLRTAKEQTDDLWLLFFSQGKLIRMDYWMSC